MTADISDLDLPVLSSEGVREFFKSGSLDDVEIKPNKMAHTGRRKGTSLSSKLSAKMKLHKDSGKCKSTSTPHGDADETVVDPSCDRDTGLSDTEHEDTASTKDHTSMDRTVNRKRAGTESCDSCDSKTKRTSVSGAPGLQGQSSVGGETDEQGNKTHSASDKSNHQSRETRKKDQSDSLVSQSHDIDKSRSASDVDQVSENVRRSDPSDVTTLTGSRGSCESPGEDGDTPQDDAGPRGTPCDEAEEDAPRGVVRVGGKTEGGLPVYINSVGVTFSIDLTDEAKEYIQDLTEEAKNGKPPTLSKMKWLTIQALEQLIKFNDRPLYNLGTHQELAATVVDFVKNGVPPRCPKCRRGALRFSNGRKKNGKKYYWCPGYSPNGFHFYGCNFKAPREDITRLPFVFPE